MATLPKTNSSGIPAPKKKKVPRFRKKKETPKIDRSNSPATEGPGMAAGVLSPEGAIMFPIAIILDVIGFVFFFLSLVGIGIPLSFLLDIAGLLTIGAWMYFRSGSVTVPKRTKKAGKKMAKKINKTALKRIGWVFFRELIPFFGDIAPCWTIAVYRELTKQPV